MKHNIFAEMLKNLPPSKCEIIPDNPEDADVAKQLSQVVNYLNDEEMKEYLNYLRSPDRIPSSIRAASWAWREECMMRARHLERLERLEELTKGE